MKYCLILLATCLCAAAAQPDNQSAAAPAELKLYYLIRPCQGMQMAYEGGGLYPNLFDACPPFQIDGNFGYAAGICEMLVQSHLGEIQLLPALPQAWPAGKVTGLRARGGFTVDIAWHAGKVTSYRVAAATARPVKLRVNGQSTTITAQAATS